MVCAPRSVAVAAAAGMAYRQVGCRQHKRRALLKIVGCFTSVLAGTIWWRGLKRLGLRRGSFRFLVGWQVCRRQHCVQCAAERRELIGFREPRGKGGNPTSPTYLASRGNPSVTIACTESGLRRNQRAKMIPQGLTDKVKVYYLNASLQWAKDVPHRKTG